MNNAGIKFDEIKDMPINVARLLGKEMKIVLK